MRGKFRSALAPLIPGLLAVSVFWALDSGQRQPPAVTAERQDPEHACSRAKGDGLPPRAPNPWFYLERAFPQGHIPRQEWQRAQLQALAMRMDSAAKSAGSWQPRGPTNVGGRITDLAVHPTNASIVYAGAAEGGVLRSEDGGQHWTPLFDDQPALSVGCLALDPSDPSTIYAGTGEVNPGGGSVAYGGAGIFRSRDEGQSWEPVGLEGSGSIGRLRIDPTDPQRIFAAVMGDLWETGPDRGVYRTTDGGQTWQNVLAVNDSTGCVDLIMRPDDPDVLLAAMWERIRRPRYYDYGGAGCGVYRTTDGGDTWTLLAGGLPSPSVDRGRIGLSLCQAQPDVMHAVYSDGVGYFDGLYRSTNGGDTWTRTNDGVLANVFSSYGWWFGNVRTHPTNPSVVFVLGLDFYRSVNGGSSWSETSGGMHVDHHGLEFGPGASPVIYEGNDGGVYRSTNGGSAWTMLPDLPVTQVYRVALDAGNTAALYCGAQDNGTNRTLSGNLDDWQSVFGGDGFQPLVHPTNSSQIWAQYQYGSLYYSSNGGSSWSPATSGIGFSDRFNWNCPLIQDPTNTGRRYFGTNRLYRSSSSTSWTAISGDLTGGPGGGSGQVSGTLTTLAVSPLDGDVIWTGSDDGNVNVTTSGGVIWTNVSAGVPQRWITSVRCDPQDRETGYVTVSGFRWAEPLPHVYRTTDLGASWEPIAGNLPEAPANDIFIDPNFSGRYYVATDLGLFVTLNGGVTWNVLGADLPRVVVTCLAFESGSRTLIAGTYGRSFFAYPLDQLTAVPEPEPGGDSAQRPGADLAALGRLDAPYPNPTSGSALISWEIGSAATAEVEIFTVAGRRVWSRSFAGKAGRGQVEWGGLDRRGRRMPAGVYLVRVLVGGRELGHNTIVLRR